MEARESRGETPAGEELAKLPLDKPGQTFPVPQRRRLRAKRLEVIAHDVIEDALRRIARLKDRLPRARATHRRAACQAAR